MNLRFIGYIHSFIFIHTVYQELCWICYTAVIQQDCSDTLLKTWSSSGKAKLANGNDTKDDDYDLRYRPISKDDKGADDKDEKQTVKPASEASIPRLSFIVVITSAVTLYFNAAILSNTLLSFNSPKLHVM